MEKKEILSLFKKAKKDWNQPIEKSYENNTCDGFCYYFYATYRADINSMLNQEEIEKYLKPYWIKYAIRTVCAYNFIGFGNEPEGRKERQKALDKIIRALENELKIEL